MFAPASLFLPRLIFVSKDKAYLSEEPLRCSILGQAPGFTKLDFAGKVGLIHKYLQHFILANGSNMLVCLSLVHLFSLVLCNIIAY